MKQTGWKSPYAKSPALPKQRASDTHKGHQVKTAKVVTDRQKRG